MATFIFKEFSNGIRDVKTGILYPFRVQSFAPGSGVLTRKPNIRYFIHSLTMSVSSLVTDAGTYAMVQGIQDHELFTLARAVKTTLVVDRFNQSFSVGVLLDKEAVLDFLAPDITTASLTVKYAEVDDLA